MITLRSLDWPSDADKLKSLDTSYTATRRYELTQAGFGASLESSALESPFSKRYPLQDLDLAEARAAFVAESDGQIVGLVAVGYAEWNRRAIIEHLYVDRTARGRGLGTALLAEARRAAAEWGARALWVETQNVNPDAIEFYVSHGFQFCGLDTSLYDPQEIPDELAVFLALALDRGAARLEYGKASSV